jgi:hypothetical protein
MRKRHGDPEFDPEEIGEMDPLGEQAFEESGFADAPDGGPDFSADELIDDSFEKPDAAAVGQKIAGVPEENLTEPNSSSDQRPDSSGVVIRVRGGDLKGDPAVGGTRPHDLE